MFLSIVLSKPDLLCYILHIQFTFTQTSECFLSNDTKNMHILGSVPEWKLLKVGGALRGLTSLGYVGR